MQYETIILELMSRVQKLEEEVEKLKNGIQSNDFEQAEFPTKRNVKVTPEMTRLCYEQAKKAYALEETPIGCVIVHEGKIIARGYNRRNTDKSPLAHAEISAIKKASKKLGDWRLEECTLYVTLEPCQMCAGAIIQSRIPRVVVGCMNPKAGCAGSVLNLLDVQAFNHQAEVKTKVLEEECSLMMKQFFRELRAKQKMKKKSLLSE